MKRCFGIAFLVGMLVLMLSACGGLDSSSPQGKAENQINNKVRNHKVYIPKNDIELRNYNLRQRLADDPSTILWCTFFPGGLQGVTNGSTPGQAFTVPIAGKLTSSNKRPYPTSQTTYSDGSSGIVDNGSSEVSGPDGMFGSSSEYRFGFDPTLNVYYDFTNLGSFCTTEPTIWQTTQTTIVVKTDTTINNLSQAAQASIKAGNPQKALTLLKKAETVQNKRSK